MITLMPHQTAAVERARVVSHLGLFMDAGTGKTAAMIRILEEEYEKRGRISNTLIFAPISVCQQWKSEFAKFSKIKPTDILVLTGTGASRVKQLKESGDDACIVVTNYESVQIQNFYETLLAWSPDVVVFDECHRLKNSQSKRAKRIYPLALAARRRFILTGTPILNSLMDVFGQFKALDPTIFGGKFFAFRSTYFHNKNAGRQFSFPEWLPHPDAERRIAGKIAPYSIQAKREECLSLPPLQIIKVPVEMTAPQAKAYKELKKHFVTEVAGLTSSVEFEMTKTLRMQQILSGFIQADDGTITWFKEQPRLDALMDLIDSMGGKKCIVWTNFKPTYKAIGDRLEKADIKHAFLTGEETTREKQASIDGFCRGAIQILIANPAAGSEGINLQESPFAIFYTRGYSLLHYLQSLARNYRSGSEKLHSTVAHYHLCTKETLDEVIANSLIDKKDLGDEVLKWAKQTC